MPMEFEDGYNGLKRPISTDELPPLIKFMVRHGLAKDESEANKRLMAIAIVIFVLTAGIFIWSYIKSNTKQRLYYFPDALLRRLPPEMQIKIEGIIYEAKK